MLCQQHAGHTHEETHLFTAEASQRLAPQEPASGCKSSSSFLTPEDSLNPKSVVAVTRQSDETLGFFKAGIQGDSRGSVSVRAMVSAGQVISWCSSAVRTPSAATQQYSH